MNTLTKVLINRAKRSPKKIYYSKIEKDLYLIGYVGVFKDKYYAYWEVGGMDEIQDYSCKKINEVSEIWHSVYHGSVPESMRFINNTELFEEEPWRETIAA